MTIHRGQSSVYSMPQSNKFIVYFSILLEMVYYLLRWAGPCGYIQICVIMRYVINEINCMH